MTIAEMFRPDGDAPKMIDTMYDLLIGLIKGVMPCSDADEHYTCAEGDRSGERC